MNKSENIFFRILDIFAYFVLLNAIWIICCVPILTIFPATTALFGVVRKWHSEGTDAGSIRLFFSLFRENFKRSFIIGVLWTIAGVILFVDWSILQQVEFTGKIVVFALLIFSIMLFIFMTIYIFFVLVHYELSILQTLKNALFLSLGYFIHTLLLLVTIVGAITITIFAPIFIMIFGSILAFSMYFIFHKLSIKVQQQLV
ncbi:YesL family protein [Gracilibacillus sp. D59]|uniref:YesL family protein n=1 Tax=Gracilibacillus sp. D59 TaxID=3457434 RepID=UPI003FCE7AB8